MHIRRVIIYGMALTAVVFGSIPEALATIICPVPTVISISPTSGPAGTSVTITGPDLFTSCPPLAVTFGSTAATSVIVVDDTHITAVSPPGTGTVDVTITAGPATSPTSPADQFTYTASTGTDSQKLQALQILISKLVATSSGAAITGAINGAIGDAFSNGGSPVTLGPNGMTFNFAAEPKSDVAARTDDAFSALGYAGIPTKAPPRISLDREWSAWADVHGTGWNSNQTSGGFNGDQVNVTAGLGRKLTPDFLVGVVAGYEHFNYDVAALTGNMKGDGGTIGGYAAWRILQTLRWDTTLAWSDIAYNGTAGTASGSFTGHRWLASTGLTGTYGLGATILEPSAKVYALWEDENAYTDSLGTLQASRNFSAGMASAGGKLIYPWLMGNGTKLSPYAGLYGDYRFSTDNALPAGLPVVGIGDGWSARVTGGVAYTAAGGASLSLGGEYGGLGAAYKVWTANARGTLPF